MRRFCTGMVCLAGLLLANTDAHAWGALAVGQKEFGWGISYDYGTKDAARSRALQLCKKEGEGCKLITTFGSQWAGLAVGRASRNVSAWGFAKGKSKKKVEEEALRQCRAAGGRNCRIEFLECDRSK